MTDAVVIHYFWNAVEVVHRNGQEAGQTASRREGRTGADEGANKVVAEGLQPTALLSNVDYNIALNGTCPPVTSCNVTGCCKPRGHSRLIDEVDCVCGVD